MRLVAVNGRKFDDEELDAVLRAAQSNQAPIEMLVQNLDTYSTLKVDYHTGPKYPHLTQVEGAPDRLGDVIAAKATR
jgi:hypothetical protein